MVDQWYYSRDNRDPLDLVSGDELRHLAQVGILLPTDWIWPLDGEPEDAVRAEAALCFPDSAVPQPAEDLPGSSPTVPVPEWVSGLAKALDAGTDPAKLSNPPVESWLDDVRRAEENT